MRSLYAMMGAVVLTMTPALATEEHVVFSPSEIKWGPAPAALPPGAEAAVLFGDPTKDGQFALRLKLPSGYHVPPHTHPARESVTVVSGSFGLGMGEKADEAAAKALSAGSFVSMPAETAHFVYTEEETIIQLNSVGPWGIKYINPEDDPRKTQ